MNLALVFHLSLYGLTALAGAMLAVGEETPFPSGVTVVFAVLAFFFNERNPVVRISNLWGNVLGATAFGVAAFEFFGEREDARLLAGAHFLVYLTWIVLWQDKGLRQYWWLVALGLLQVAVGSVMTLSGVYGAIMMAYLLLALWTLSVFTLYQGAATFNAIPRAAAAGIGEEGAAVLPVGPVWTGPGTQDKNFLERTSRTRNSIQQEAPNRWITPRLVGVVVSLSAAGMALGLAVFLLVPRVWIGQGNRFVNRSEMGGRSLTGFSSEVRLGQLGRILESTERVMRVRVFDRDTDTQVDLHEFTRRMGMEEPLFRGTALDVYNKGKWSDGGWVERISHLWSQPRTPGMLRQEIILDPIGTDVVFALRPIHLGFRKVPAGSLYVDLNAWSLSTRGELREGDFRGPMEYYVFSRPPAEATESEHAPRLLDLPPLTRMSPDARTRTLQLPESGLLKLSKLALELTQPQKLAGPTGDSETLRTAKTLESHLSDSGIYSYSLNMNVIDPEADPVEDFLINRKTGHCEYFASALALMLRSVGIPSRLITGFKGTNPTSSGGYHEVQQRHAHSWVEAFVDGEWITLDPTPASREESVREIAANTGFWKNTKTSLTNLWSNYVVNLTYSRQQQDLYDPLKETFSSQFAATRESIRNFGGFTAWTNSRFAIVVGLIVAAFILIILRRIPWWNRIDSRRNGGRTSPRRGLLSALLNRWFGRTDDNRPIAFYERFLELLAGLGLQRRPEQTQQEFADIVQRSLAEKLVPAGLETLPARVTDSFYRIRFGQQDLSPDSERQLSVQLDRLADCLTPRTAV